MLLPIFGQKLFNDDFAKWGINYHYSIEFVPILTIALFSLISDIEKKKPKFFEFSNNIHLYIAIVSCIITFTATIWKMDHRTSKWYSSEKQNFYDKKHYIVNFKAVEVHQALNLIPENVIVSAQTNLAPHLAYRDTIYLFPAVNDAQYIALLNNGNYYPTSKEIFEIEKRKYLSSLDWKVIYNKNKTLILKKQ
jgi:uncharacterized membrane protein